MAVQLFRGVLVIVLYSEMLFLCFMLLPFLSLCDSLMINIICVSNCVYIPTDRTTANAGQSGLRHKNCIGNVANGKQQEDCT